MMRVPGTAPAISVATLTTPIGRISVTAVGRAVRAVQFGGPPRRGPRSSLLERALRQLEAYFAGRLRHFDLPLDPAGTTFQKRVWRELGRIPFGDTVTYGEIAAQVGNARASRAVGGANHRNPIAIIIPCHRVVGAGGALTGYASGIERKAWLLEHERRLR